MRRDAGLGGALLVLSVAYYWMATAIPDTRLADAVGPQALPKTYALVLVALSLILIVRSRRSSDHSPQTPDSPFRPARLAGFLLIGIAYIALVPFLGYVVALAGLILAATWLKGGVLNRQIAAVAAGGAIAFWLLFVLLLGIPHPPGVWPELLNVR